MKTLFTSIIVLFLSFVMNAQETYTVKVAVNNATNDTGKMIYTLNTEAQFMTVEHMKEATIEIKDGVAVAVFENVPAGEYGIMVLHDKNENGKMDFNSKGMPLEDYGTSNNIITYGPPQWNDSKITITKDTDIVVRL